MQGAVFFAYTCIMQECCKSKRNLRLCFSKAAKRILSYQASAKTMINVEFAEISNKCGLKQQAPVFSEAAVLVSKKIFLCYLFEKMEWIHDSFFWSLNISHLYW